MTVETKAKLSAVDDGTGNMKLFEVRDASMSRGVNLLLWKDYCTLTFQSGATYAFAVDEDNYNVFRLTSLGGVSPTIELFINGIKVFSKANATVAAIGADLIQFGVSDSTANPTALYEYFAYFGSGAAVYPPVLGSTAGQLDDIALMRTSISNAVVSQLVNNTASVVYEADPRSGPELPAQNLMSETTLGNLVNGQLYFPSDGKTLMKLQLSGKTIGASFLALNEDALYALQSIDVPAAETGINFRVQKVFKAGLRLASLNSGGSAPLLVGNLFVEK